MYAHVHVCVCMRGCVRLHLCVLYVRMGIFVYVYTCMYMCVFLENFYRLCAYMCAFFYVCTWHAYLYICMHSDLQNIHKIFLNGSAKYSSTHSSNKFDICVFFKKKIINTYVYMTIDINVCVCKQKHNTYAYTTVTKRHIRIQNNKE